MGLRRTIMIFHVSSSWPHKVVPSVGVGYIYLVSATLLQPGDRFLFSLTYRPGVLSASPPKVLGLFVDFGLKLTGLPSPLGLVSGLPFAGTKPVFSWVEVAVSCLLYTFI